MTKTHNRAPQPKGCTTNSQKPAFRLILLGLLIFGSYAASALVVLDFTQVAYTFDEETFGGRQVALGPQPRVRFCTPAHFDIPGGADYDGSE